MKLAILSMIFGLSWSYAMPWKLGKWPSRLAEVVMAASILFLIIYVVWLAPPEQ